LGKKKKNIIALWEYCKCPWHGILGFAIKMRVLWMPLFLSINICSDNASIANSFGFFLIKSCSQNEVVALGCSIKVCC